MLGCDNHGHQFKKSRTTLFLQEFSNIMFVCIFLWSIYGAGSCAEWAAEGRRLVPLMPRLVPQTVFSASATAAANSAAAANAKAPASSGTVHQTCWYFLHSLGSANTAVRMKCTAKVTSFDCFLFRLLHSSHTCQIRCWRTMFGMQHAASHYTKSHNDLLQ